MSYYAHSLDFRDAMKDGLLPLTPVKGGMLFMHEPLHIDDSMPIGVGILHDSDERTKPTQQKIAERQARKERKFRQCLSQ